MRIRELADAPGPDFEFTLRRPPGAGPRGPCLSGPSAIRASTARRSATGRAAGSWHLSGVGDPLRLRPAAGT